MTARERLGDRIIEPDEVVLLDDEAFVESLVGVTSDMCAVYDYDIMAREYSERNHIPIEEAMEHIDYNIIRCLPMMGKKVPIIMDSIA